MRTVGCRASGHGPAGSNLGDPEPEPSPERNQVAQYECVIEQATHRTGHAELLQLTGKLVLEMGARQRTRAWRGNRVWLGGMA